MLSFGMPTESSNTVKSNLDSADRRGSDNSDSGDGMPRKTLQTQVSIESPTLKLKECIFSFDIPMPEVPSKGARIKVKNAGVCYRLRSASSNASIKSFEALGCGSPLHASVRDTSLFPGYEVAGTVDAIGDEVVNSHDIQVEDRVIVYPYEGHPPGYAEYVSVPDIDYLVKIPEAMSMSVAAMLPSGALWAINTVFNAQKHVEKVLEEKGEDGICKILLVGTGGLALWAMRIARYYWATKQDRTKIVVACLRDEGISIAKDHHVNLVRWNEDLYEEQLVERTQDACGGLVDIVIDFSATSRSIRRALKCLAKDGVLLMSSERAEGLIARFSCEAEKENHKLVPVELGSLDQLRNLVHLVSTGELEPPPHHIFPADRANEALSKIGRGQIMGHAILEFPEEEEE